jgi:hypothetical protein
MPKSKDTSATVVIRDKASGTLQEVGAPAFDAGEYEGWEEVERKVAKPGDTLDEKNTAEPAA